MKQIFTIALLAIAILLRDGKPKSHICSSGPMGGCPTADRSFIDRLFN